MGAVTVAALLQFLGNLLPPGYSKRSGRTAIKKEPMENVDLRGLPGPIARAVAAMVEAIRQQLAKRSPVKPPVREFPRWPGTVLGTLSREEIYDDRA
jgi:hypothetical protein